MKTLDEALALLAKLKGESAPEYIYDITGIAHKAIEARESRERSLPFWYRKWLEWNRETEPLPYNDENPY